MITFSAIIFADIIDLLNGKVDDDYILSEIGDRFSEQDSSVFYGVLEKLHYEKENEDVEMQDIMDADEFLQYVSFNKESAVVDEDAWRNDVKRLDTTAIRLQCSFDEESFCTDRGFQLPAA